MLLIYTQKLTPRISYIFKHICSGILGIEITFTSVLEELIAHEGPKLSYGRQQLGNELFLQAHGLLTQQGIESIEIIVKKWEDTIGFFSVSTKSALPFDIFSAGFYLLSRYEEYLPHVKDELGRFPASESLGGKEDFLLMPVVDQWAYKFREILSETFPGLVFSERKMIIHDLLECRQPYAYKHKGFFRGLVGYLQDLLKLRMRKMLARTQVILGFRKDPFDTFKWVITVAKKRKKKLTFFFFLGENPVFEESFNTHRQYFKMLIKLVNDYKEVGLQFSADLLANYEKLKKEKQQLEEITNRTLASAMTNHYYVKLPELYRNFVELEIKKDFTMVYEDTPGFRAGTCTPFLYYDLDFEIKTPLVIHPIAATTQAFASKFASDINKTVMELYSSVEKINGTFSIFFSNKDFSPADSNKIWRSLFSEKL